MNFMDFVILIFEVYFAIMGIVVFAVILMKLRKRGALLVLVLKVQKAYEWVQIKPQKDKLPITKDWQPTYESSCFMREEKPFWKFWRMPKEFLIAVEGQPKCINFKDMTDENITALAHHWTDKEIKQLIKREIGLALIQQKPMSMSMFIVIVLIQVVNLVLLLFVSSKSGGI